MAGTGSGGSQLIPSQESEREQEVELGYKISRGALMTHFLQQAGSIPQGSITFLATPMSWGVGV